MLHRRLLILLTCGLGAVAVAAHDTAACHRLRHRQCVCPPQRHAENTRPVNPINPRALPFLAILENATESSVVRAQAALQLAEVAEASCVDRLTALLPGDWDAMTFYIVAILGKVGDRLCVAGFGEDATGQIR